MSARLATRRVYLDYVRPSDFGLIYDLYVSLDAGPLFRFAGGTPSPAQVQEQLWHDVLAHWMVTGVRDDRRRGLVTIASADLANGYAFVSVVAVPGSRRSGLVLEGLGLAVHHAFRTWPFRKLYAEVCEPALEQFQHLLGRFCVEEGRLKQHRFHEGAFRDVVTLAMYREHWVSMVEQFESLAMPRRQQEDGHDGLDRGVSARGHAAGGERYGR